MFYDAVSQQENVLVEGFYVCVLYKNGTASSPKLPFSSEEQLSIVCRSVVKAGVLAAHLSIKTVAFHFEIILEWIMESVADPVTKESL